MMNENARGMLPPTVAYFLGACALLVLLAAAFNYVNLSVARSLTRAREVGVRGGRAQGARRPPSACDGPVSRRGHRRGLGSAGTRRLLLAGLVPAFNGLSVVAQMGVQIKIEPGLRFYGIFVLFSTGIGGLAGLYPAWHLSAFQPARVLKSSMQVRVIYCDGDVVITRVESAGTHLGMWMGIEPSGQRVQLKESVSTASERAKSWNIGG